VKLFFFAKHTKKQHISEKVPKRSENKNKKSPYDAFLCSGFLTEKRRNKKNLQTSGRLMIISIIV
jgi:hypothetical protein